MPKNVTTKTKKLQEPEFSIQTFFDLNDYDVDPTFSNDEYETPDGTGGSLRLAQAFAKLVGDLPGHLILDCTAGSGRVAQFLPLGAVCVEIRADRVETGKARASQCEWHCGNFLKMGLHHLGRSERFACILSNLPFSIAIPFIAHCRDFLTPDGTLLFLLPVNYFSTGEHADALAELEAEGLRRIHLYQIRGRVGYLKGNVPLNSRQCDDAIHAFSWDPTRARAITTLSLQR